MSGSKNICSTSIPCRMNGPGGEIGKFGQDFWESFLKGATQLAGTPLSSSSNLDVMFSAPVVSVKMEATC